MIHVIDYGVGNLGSVMNMLHYLDIPAKRITSPDMLHGAQGLILPGVGAFDAAVGRFEESGFKEPLLDVLVTGEIKLLGICVGMQMLGDGSEEGGKPGLGLVPGRCTRFPNKLENGERLRVPHMGWSELKILAEHPIIQEFESGARFYFVHSYHHAASDEDIVAQAEYGVDFNAIIARGNVVGCQFHPEKSHRFGMRLFRNFHQWVSE